jgi:hypothetical protein
VTYTFKYRVANAHGWSGFSDPVSILCSTVPSQPQPPTVAVSNTVNVLISWAYPDDGGYQVTAYQIFIQKSDGSFAQHTAGCDGSLNSIVTNRQCTVSMNSLMQSPFNLVKDSNVIAKITATNVVGTSIESNVNGAPYVTISTIPNTPSTSPTITDYSET